MREYHQPGGKKKSKFELCFLLNVYHFCTILKLKKKKVKKQNKTRKQNTKTKLTWFEELKELTHWKRPWYWERMKAGGGDYRGWDGWMTSLTQWTWVWASSRSWWWTGKPGVLQSIGSKESDMTDWLNWTESKKIISQTIVKWRQSI